MENQQLCMNCMKPIEQTDEKCPHCRYPVDKPNPAGFLPAGADLGDHYTVGRALGNYGDACIYVGYDRLLKSPVFIREFFPANFSQRAKTGDVLPTENKEGAFDVCRESFYANARALAKVKELPALLPLYDIFTANSTVYAVYDHCEGHTLSQELKRRGGTMEWSELRPLLNTLMNTVAGLHRAGIYHLGISPDTIMVANDGKLRLRGFAIPQARTTGTPIKPRLAEGFAAPEQYVPRAACGQAADVYGLAATIFRTVSGNNPPEAPKRARGADDLLLPAEVAEKLPETVGLALFNALIPDVDSRTATVEDFRAALTAEPAVNALLGEEDETPAPVREKKAKNYTPLYIGITVLAVLGILAGIVLMFLFPSDEPTTPTSDDTAVSTTTTAPTTPTTYIDPNNSYAVPNLVGKNYYTEKNADRAGDFVLKIDHLEYNDKKGKGEILSQTPAAGEAVEAGATISVIISIGSESLTVPDVAGWPDEYAKKYLEALGFKVETMQLNISAFDKGLVDSCDPAQGTTLTFGDTVTLRVSNVQPIDGDDVQPIQ